MNETAGLASRMIRGLGAAALVVVSLMLGLIIVELSCYFFVPSVARASANKQLFDWNHRIIFFEGAGSIFQNDDDIFTYVPHDDIRTVLGYFSNKDFSVEYDYRFHTNNFGLVQDFDIAPARPSILLLGDSFTEGQGAAPWFRQLATQGNEVPYQLINGGFAGTGFEQWGKLARHLKCRNVNIRKLIVLFISDDLRRAVWNFPQAELRCLQSLSACTGDEQYRRLPSSTELAATIDKIKTLRDTPKRRVTARARMALPASFLVYDYLRSILFTDQLLAEQRAVTTIAALVEEYGSDNVAFLHLPQKDELDGMSEPGMQERRAIQAAGGKLYDGFQLCHLTPADYHVRDPHLNAQGYGKIANCVGKVLHELTANVP